MSLGVQRKTVIVASSCQVVGGVVCVWKGRPRIGAILIGTGFSSGIKAFSETTCTVRDYAKQLVLSVGGGLISGWCGDGVVRLLPQSAKPLVIAAAAHVVSGATGSAVKIAAQAAEEGERPDPLKAVQKVCIDGVSSGVGAVASAAVVPAIDRLTSSSYAIIAVAKKIIAGGVSASSSQLVANVCGQKNLVERFLSQQH